MKKKTILFFVLLIAVSLLLFIQTFSSLVHTPERTGTAGLWVNFFVNLPCCILIGYADYRVAKSLQKRFPDRNIIRIALSILLTALPVGLLAVVANYAAARLYAHPFSIAGSVFPIVLWNSLIVLFIELFFYNRRQIEQQRRLAVMEKEKALFQFEALKNQINPHFLYNTLESIRSEALVAGLASVADMTEALAVFFRYTISKLENIVSVEEELQNCLTYFHIQQYRFGDRLQFQIDCDEEDREEIFRCRIPKLTLQPIFENSIIHGTELKMGAGKVTIKLERTENLLQITVSDDGVGMEEDVLAQLNDRLDKSGKAIGSSRRKRAEWT